MRMALTVSFVAFALVLGGCKFGYTTSTTKEGEADSTAAPDSLTETVHGEQIPVVQYQQVLASLGGSQIPNIGDPNATQYALTELPAGKSLALAGGTAYMQKCETNDVPVPPAWIDGATGRINAKWTVVAKLPASRIFALDSQLETTLYQYVDAKGTCAALPRGPAGQHATNVDALGMICQGKNGKACFWDNKSPPVLEGTAPNGNKVRYQAKIAAIADIRPELMADGDNLLENCSGCHRGDNIFIVHEDTDMTKLEGRFPENGVRADPISAQGWSNPEGSKKVGGGCVDSGCHASLPVLTPEYCSTVLLPSIGRTMPPKPETVADYAVAIKELEDECARISRGLAPTAP